MQKKQIWQIIKTNQNNAKKKNLADNQNFHPGQQTCILVVAALLPPMSLLIIDFLLGSLKNNCRIEILCIFH